MNNIRFLTEILTTDSEYWVVAKEMTASVYGRMERQKDHILLIAIPALIKRGISNDEIKLQDLERLQSCNVIENIHLNADYAPFQTGITFYNIYKGFALSGNFKQFLIEALTLDSNDIYQYKELFEKINPVK